MNVARPELDRLQVFFGDANPAEARIYACLSRKPDVADCTLTGSVVGPKNMWAQTLPASVPLVDKMASDRQSSDSLLAEAVMPDPCFWTPQSPSLYDVRVQLNRESQAVVEVQRTIGIRRLGRHGRRLVFDGQVWVLRAVERHALTSKPTLGQWHAGATAMYVTEWDEGLLHEASQVGVLLVVDVCHCTESLPKTVERLGRAAAVGMVVLSEQVDTSAVELARRLARNLLFVWRPNSPSGTQTPDWADAVICPADDVQQIPRPAADRPLPIIARRPSAPQDSIIAGRAACDLLQRDLAGQGDLAGYIV